jgi:hypothetical protein
VRENNKCNSYEIVRPCFTINDAKEITTNRSLEEPEKKDISIDAGGGKT